MIIYKMERKNISNISKNNISIIILGIFILIIIFILYIFYFLQPKLVKIKHIESEFINDVNENELFELLHL
jgi:uncharacterized membrane protein YukC